MSRQHTRDHHVYRKCCPFPLIVYAGVCLILCAGRFDSKAITVLPTTCKKKSLNWHDFTCVVCAPVCYGCMCNAETLQMT